MSLLKAMLWWGLVVTPEAAEEPELTTIIVAAVDLPAGTVLTRSLIVELALPASAVTPSMVTSLELFLDEPLRLPLLKGDPLLTSFLWAPGLPVEACSRLAPTTAREQVAHHRHVVRQRVRR